MASYFIPLPKQTSHEWIGRTPYLGYKIVIPDLIESTNAYYLSSTAKDTEILGRIPLSQFSKGVERVLGVVSLEELKRFPETFAHIQNELKNQGVDISKSGIQHFLLGYKTAKQSPIGMILTGVKAEKEGCITVDPEDINDDKFYVVKAIQRTLNSRNTGIKTEGAKDFTPSLAFIKEDLVEIYWSNSRRKEGFWGVYHSFDVLPLLDNPNKKAKLRALRKLYLSHQITDNLFSTDFNEHTSKLTKQFSTLKITAGEPALE